MTKDKIISIRLKECRYLELKKEADDLDIPLSTNIKLNLNLLKRKKRNEE